MRVLILTSGRIRERVAGPGIRALEIGARLARDHDVVVGGGDGDGELVDGVRLERFTRRSAARLLADREVVIASACPPWLLPLLRARQIRLVADLYDPLVFERLEAGRHGAHSEDPVPAGWRVAQASRLAGLQLDAADFVICASERQRDLLLGMLLTRGRISPARYAADPSLRGLIDVVPFGIPDDDPVPEPGALRSLLSGGGDGVIALWNGTPWKWLDIRTAVRATAAAAGRGVPLRLVVLAGVGEGWTARLADLDGARQLAEELGVLGTSVQFVGERVPHERRGTVLLDADFTVALHGDHAESRFAVRSRILDALWCARPAAVTTGDDLGERMAAAGAAVACPPGDHLAVSTAFERLCDPHARTLAGSAGDALRAELRWSAAVKPLEAFLQAPRSVRRRRGLAARVGAYYAGQGPVLAISGLAAAAGRARSRRSSPR